MVLKYKHQTRMKELEGYFKDEFDRDVRSEIQVKALASRNQLAHALLSNQNFALRYPDRERRYYQQEKEAYVAQQIQNLLIPFSSESYQIDALLRSIRMLYTSFGKRPELDQKLQYISEYFKKYPDPSYSKYPHQKKGGLVWEIYDLLAKEKVESLNILLEQLFVIEKDCKNKERFWTVLAQKLFEKKEYWKEISVFIEKIKEQVVDKEKMRIFIAYYFDAHRYDQNPKRCMHQALSMINAPDPKCDLIGEYDFNISTYAKFQKRDKSDLPLADPDYISYIYTRYQDQETGEYLREQTPRISSKYWYTEEGVFRLSDHRGLRIGFCSWVLSEDYGDEYQYEGSGDQGSEENMKNDIRLGFCNRKDFSRKKTFTLSDDLYWENGDEKELPTIPLESLGKMVLISQSGEVSRSKIRDISSFKKRCFEDPSFQVMVPIAQNSNEGE